MKRTNTSPLNRRSGWFFRSTPGELPKELEGKTPAEVGAYYQNLLNIQKSTYDSALETLSTNEPQPGPTPEVKEKPISMSDFLTDPAKHTSDIIKKQSVSREEFLAATKTAQQGFIYMAKTQALDQLKREVEKAGGTLEWTRFEDDIMKIINGCDAVSQTNPATWTAAYYYVMGTKAATLVKEGVTRATMPMESGSPGGNEPEKEIELTMEQKTVAAGLGLTDDTYRQSTSRMKKQQFPLTIDNRNRR